MVESMHADGAVKLSRHGYSLYATGEQALPLNEAVYGGQEVEADQTTAACAV
jgi:hypothetical protein